MWRSISLAMAAAVVTAVAAAPAASSANDELRLIAFSDTESRWMTIDEIVKLASVPGQRGNFRDITDFPKNLTLQDLDESSIPDEPVHEDLVKSYIERLDRKGIFETITSLSAYHNRYYTQPTGREAVEWLMAQYKAAAGTRTDISIELFEHSWEQPSLIVTIFGKGDAAGETVVLGGHIDSTAGGPSALSPGADDDASGSATVLQVFKTLMVNRFQPDRTIEFHAYAAEEAGLRGSADVSADYSRTRRNVVSMVQFDMVGYPTDNSPIGLTTDRVSSVLTQFVGKLIDAYSILKHEPSVCGYGCSDHASWTAVNVPSSFPFECRFGSHNPAIHTANDVISRISETRCNEFAKLGIGYVVEMGLVNGADGVAVEVSQV